MAENFRQWLSGQSKRDDEIGELARVLAGCSDDWQRLGDLMKLFRGGVIPKHLSHAITAADKQWKESCKPEKVYGIALQTGLAGGVASVVDFYRTKREVRIGEIVITDRGRKFRVSSFAQSGAKANRVDKIILGSWETSK